MNLLLVANFYYVLRKRKALAKRTALAAACAAVIIFFAGMVANSWQTADTGPGRRGPPRPAHAAPTAWAPTAAVTCGQWAMPGRDIVSRTPAIVCKAARRGQRIRN